MSKASIVTIGNEVLSGHTVNTNAAYLGQKMLEKGIDVISERTVGDEIAAIVQALKAVCQEADIILATGGLGPTADDLTRQAMAEFLGVELQLDEGLLKTIKEMFRKRGIVMTPNNKTQTYLPKGTKAIENKIGTAAGIRAVWKDRSIYCMPGVPYEMKQMFEESILPEIEKGISKKGEVKIIRKLNCYGQGESKIADMLGDLSKRGRNPEINFTISYGVVTLHITARAANLEKANKLADCDERQIRTILGDLIFSAGDETLAQAVGRMLVKKKMTLATAESCTGGLLSGMITEVPGSSRYFLYGWITYSNEAKISQLCVPREIIERYGAVSEQTAEAMAKGAKKKSGADVSVSITGIAGPDGGSEQKPVGLVYICVETGKQRQTYRYILPGDRKAIRIRAANNTMNIIRLALKGID